MSIRHCLNGIKSGFRAAFLSVLAFALHTGTLAATSERQVEQIQQLALGKQLDASPRWAALLHLNGLEPQIKDEHFILTLGDFSPRKELIATIALLYGSQAREAACRFPARLAWLQTELQLPVTPTDQCVELTDFLARAPAQTISLVFASENLSQPSSMMGHLFLKVSGRNAEGQTLEHAISFFTDADSFNIPKLFYDSMVVGKPGYFLLSPYKDEQDQYLVKEQRSLWEYDLALQPYEFKLLQLHMIELKHARITYFFQDFNCATLVEQILAIAAPHMQDKPSHWVTPKSVIQRAQSAQLIANVTVRTPAKWLVKNVQGELPDKVVQQTQALVDADKTSDLATWSVQLEEQQGFLVTNLARAYNHYRFEQKDVTFERWQKMDQALRPLEQRFAGLALETNTSRDPSLAPRERQLSLGWRHHHGRDLLKLDYLPMSHKLEDNNTEYNSENELRLFDSALLIDPRNGKVSIDHLTVYGTQSLLPRDPMTGGLSGGVTIGFDRQMKDATRDGMAFLMEGNIGATWRPSRDIDAFALMGGGWGYHQHGYLYAKPTLGMLVREVFDMKSIITISQISRPLGQSGATTEMRLTQSKYLDKQNTVMLDVVRTRRSGQTVNRLDLSFKRLF
ncbi:MAG: DUF4105 domain-containing protein [Aquabacterium sp.]|nr:MAG: DUF4105 domain-containing protein [Aquabacterium sp.]